MRIASVILDITTQALDAPYTYAVSDDAGEVGDYEICVGCAVVVPLGGRQAVGFVIGIDECEPDRLPGGLDASKLKYIKRAVSPPYFDEEGAACAQWLSERYIAPLSVCVRLFTPPGGVPRMVRAKQGYWHLEQPAVGEVDDRWVMLGPAAADFEPRKNAVKQMQVIEALKRGELRAAELAVEFGNVSSTLKSLQEKGVVIVEHRRRMRNPDGLPPMQGAVRSRLFAGMDAADGDGRVAGEGAGADAGASEGAACDNPVPVASHPDGTVSYAAAFVPSPKPPLTAGQQNALEAIRAADARARGEVVLVDGVTGSGKTEVYLQAIEDVLASGRTACVLVPEISLTPQTVARFRGRFGDMVAVMHSRMSQGERYDQWDFIRSGAARVVVGARSALFTPMRNVGLIVIDEEHEGSYKQDSAPRYHARDVAIWMARRSGATVVLGSATPSIESLYAANKDPLWTQIALPERANGKPMPLIQVVDMAREFKGGSRSMFSHALTDALAQELFAGRKAVLLLNQRGFAKFVLCRDCGFVPSCPSCSTALTFHEYDNVLMCHHCGYRVVAPAVCPACGGPYLRRFGAGTERVESELRVLLNGFGEAGERVPIIRMDADTTGAKGAHQRLLEEFAQPGPAVLLGTQMIAKGLDFDDVTLVGVISADTQLHLPDYRAGERTFDLIEQVAGRAGRAELPGRVLVQTYEAQAVPVLAAATYDRAFFLRDELPKRRALRYPPYARLCNVLIWGKDEGAVRTGAERLHAELAERVRDYAVGPWEVLAASPCVLAKLRNVHRWHILVKAPQDADVAQVLLPLFRARKAHPDYSVAVDIDPLDLL